ncbi:Uncharacterised protein g10170 [Pycnogonum litorale]
MTLLLFVAFSLLFNFVGSQMDCFERLKLASGRCSVRFQDRINKYSSGVGAVSRQQDRDDVCLLMDDFVACLDNSKSELSGCPPGIIQAIDQKMWEERENSRQSIGCGCGQIALNLALVFVCVHLTFLT